MTPAFEGWMLTKVRFFKFVFGVGSHQYLWESSPLLLPLLLLPLPLLRV